MGDPEIDPQIPLHVIQDKDEMQYVRGRIIFSINNVESLEIIWKNNES